MVVVLVLLVGVSVGHAQTASDAQKAVDSTVYLLEQSTTVQRSGRHNRLLLSLRHLRDPSLKPFFAHLASAEHPILRIHGILGLAEVHQPEPRLPLRQLAEVEASAVQVQLISAALDDELLPMADARKLLTWSDLDTGVKLLIALRLVEHGQLQGTAILHEALAARRLARRGLAALMLHQLGEEAGTEALQAINNSEDPQRDAVRLMLVRSALRHNLHRTGTWAYAMATEPNTSEGLKRAALRLALRYGDPRAVELWTGRFTAAQGPADRNRIALLALETAPWVESKLFEAMQQSAKRELTRQVAAVGKAITMDRSDIADQVVKLVRMNHPTFSAWALRYAREHAATTDAQLILLELVMAYQDGPETGQTRRLDHAIQATELLYEQSPQVTINLLRPVLTNKETDPQLVRAILLGLVRTQAPNPDRMLDGIKAFEDRQSERLALLLRAKHSSTLTDSQMRSLALLARGGGNMPDAWRVQAAWAWTKRSGQIENVLQRALK